MPKHKSIKLSINFIFSKSASILIDYFGFQTYKTAMCFLTCWLIIPLGGEPCRFTPWGIVSGLFWVPGGWAGIYAIRTAGLAVAKGTWSSVIVLTSFAWGIFIFEEHVKTISGACCACATLITGLIGMSWFSRPLSQLKRKSVDAVALGAYGEEDVDHELQRIPTQSSHDSNGSILSEKAKKRVKIRRLGNEGEFTHSRENEIMKPLEMESLLHGSDTVGFVVTTTSNKKNREISIFNGHIVLTHRQAGILASLFNG